MEQISLDISDHAWYGTSFQRIYRIAVGRRRFEFAHVRLVDRVGSGPVFMRREYRKGIGQSTGSFFTQAHPV